MKEELADVLIYAILFANETGMDLNSEVQEKLHKNAIKYPVNKSFAKKEKYTEL